ncbi:MAG TPA: hypothetical protein VGR22_10115 [Thermomicrobiales bacterium]|nr:hypothetical protein [Thermomicrobiales bacterium]
MPDWQPTDTADHPKAATVRTVPLDEGALNAITETLGGLCELADFRLPASRVWRITVSGADDRPAAMLTIWPGIGRVDAVNGMATVVFSGVQTVALVPGVEAQFRRGSREVLIVARGGKVIVRA